MPSLTEVPKPEAEWLENSSIVRRPRRIGYHLPLQVFTHRRAERRPHPAPSEILDHLHSAHPVWKQPFSGRIRWSVVFGGERLRKIRGRWNHYIIPDACLTLFGANNIDVTPIHLPNLTESRPNSYHNTTLKAKPPLLAARSHPGSLSVLSWETTALTACPHLRLRGNRILLFAIARQTSRSYINDGELFQSHL